MFSGQTRSSSVPDFLDTDRTEEGYSESERGDLGVTPFYPKMYTVLGIY